MAAMRLYAAAALGLIALTTTTAHAATTRIRVAIPEFQLEGRRRRRSASSCRTASCSGGSAPARTCWIRPTPRKKLEGHPELQRCDASPCLKAIGQVLDVGYIVRVKVEVAGNSYKSVGAAVLDRRRGAGGAAHRHRIEELRRLHGRRGARGDAAPRGRPARAHRGQRAAAPRRRPRRRRPRRRGWSVRCCWRWSARSPSAPASPCSPPTASCTATGCDENRTRSAAGGVLIGAGAALTIGGTYVTIVRSRGGDPVTGVALAFRW